MAPPRHGGGERRTLPIAARFASIWHHRGPVDYLAHKLDVLLRACEAIGRDPTGIELAFDPHVIIRDEPADALAAYERSLVLHQQGQAIRQILPSTGSVLQMPSSNAGGRIWRSGSAT